MIKNISLSARKELLANIKCSYQAASWDEKIKILDGVIAATGYKRKYVINMLNKAVTTSISKTARLNSNKYDTAVREALIIIWHAANKICSKRLVPFLPEFIKTLEHYGHLSLAIEVRNKLLTISSATMDRLLKLEHRQGKTKNMGRTRSGSLLKNQIKVRIFSDWNEIIPGFLEADLVAHCGTSVSGSFLNTLVLTDIVSGWTEFIALLCKSEANVIDAMETAKEILPFVILGLDCDNGCEFINYGLLEFCNEEKITFTRSRAYRSNDQAYVEEKNGSIVRRLVGYDRYEGVAAWKKLAELYSVMRLYVNFFQPSLKLISKERQGSKVTKKYDIAKTPYQRLMNCSTLNEEKKFKLCEQYKKLDPIHLLKVLEQKQKEFWEHAWTFSDDSKIMKEINIKNIVERASNTMTNHEEKPSDKLISLEYFRNTRKPRKALGQRLWRTRKDPFEDVWSFLVIRLEINPELTSTQLLDELIREYPERFTKCLLRTLQRRLSNWRRDQLQAEKKRQCKLMINLEADKSHQTEQY